MRDKPFGAALLDVAQQALTQDIGPALKGQQRYVVLMVANAIGIVAREIEQEAAATKAWDRALARVAKEGNLEASASRLVEAIRNGHHDADPALHSALLETAVVAAGIWKPALATPVDAAYSSWSRAGTPPHQLQASEKNRAKSA